MAKTLGGTNMADLNNANITFTANGKSEFVLRDPSFPFTCRLQFIVTTTKKIGRYTPILYIRIVLSSFISLLLMHFENISSSILRLP